MMGLHMLRVVRMTDSSPLEIQLTAEAWAALSSTSTDTPDIQPVPVQLTGSGGHLVSRFAVEPTAVAAVGVAMLAAAALHRQRGGSCHAVSVDRGHVAAAVRSERYFRRAGVAAGAGFAPLSRFWPSADGWVRTHANYPWHRAALLDTLGTSDDVAAVGAAMAGWQAEDIEQRVFAAGGIAAAVRTLDQWRAHPQGHALAGEPLIGHELAGPAHPRRSEGDLPASGIRVLDLTRVIAGPVCTRFLAALGAEVLRVDPPSHPDLASGEVADTLLGKRSAMLDLTARGSGSTLHRLLADADVVVCGYRPGALERFGLTADGLAERHPGLVVAYLDAWGHTGPWSGRRGFDSVVQAPTGIAHGESPAGADPGTLPCQLLDHATGYLAAAAVLDGLRQQVDHGGTIVRRLSLARTAMWLTSTGAPDAPSGPAPVHDPAAWLVELDSIAGPISAVTPPGRLDHRQLTWPSPVTGYGTDRPQWRSGVRTSGE
jgi:crotonobetainyl-CoA:carnitine CoA-transferase CaiB-like acyl-CoA transferase